MLREKRCVAIILAGGRGQRVNSAVPKQYLLINEKPVLYYSLKLFDESDYIDEIILVVQAGEEEIIREKAINSWEITKLTAVAAGGRERFHSVWNGLQMLKNSEEESTLVFIHDGARPFASEEIIQRGYEAAVRYGSAVAGMRCTDTIKRTDPENKVIETLDRNVIWKVQTPQIFEQKTVFDAYQKLIKCGENSVTDDAEVVEKMMGVPITMYEGWEKNIKITTPEDLVIAEAFAKGLE